MKTYLVICQDGTDEAPYIRRMTVEEVREYADKNSAQDFAVIDGEVVKGFNKKLDVGRLKDK